MQFTPSACPGDRSAASRDGRDALSGRTTVSGSKCDMRQQENIMPLLFGKLLAAVVVTTVAASIAVALGTVMALIDEADQKAQPDSKAAA